METQGVLSAIEAEVQSQPGVLKSFLKERIGKAPPGSLFVGAGDSYIASSVASYLSSMKHLALDPYELISVPALADGRSVYFISVSGRTISNVAAAKAVRGMAKETTAITANAEGKLVRATDGVIFIPYKIVPRLPGTLSFSLSLVATLRVATGRFECDFTKAYSKAQADSKKFLVSDHGVTHLLGNSALFPVCGYAALKTYEILGGRAQASMLEEFSHAGLFSLAKQDAVNAFSALDPLGLSKKLVASLRDNGYDASTVPSSGLTPFEQVFHAVFAAQSAVVREARSRGLSSPYLVGARKKLAVSDSIIY